MKCPFNSKTYLIFNFLIQSNNDAPWTDLQKEFGLSDSPPSRSIKRCLPNMSKNVRDKEKRQIKGGDILIVLRGDTLTPFYHYGVYVGDGKVVNIGSKDTGGGVGM